MQIHKNFQINENVLNLEDQMAYLKCLEISQDLAKYITFWVEFRDESVSEYGGL